MDLNCSIVLCYIVCSIYFRFTLEIIQLLLFVSVLFYR